MSILVAGAHGQVGSALARLSGTAWAFGSTDLDVRSAESIESVVGEFAAAGGRTVINAAAYTAVDRAESDEDSAMAVNALGPRQLAEACSRHGLRLIHISTDYVFAGTATRPCEPGDRTEPATVYGRSKLLGEQAVLAHGATVVRTAWVYSGQGTNFVRTMLRLAAAGKPISVVGDQWGSPTFADELAGGLLALAQCDLARSPASNSVSESVPTPRLLHATGAGRTSWYQFARAIADEAGYDVGLIRECTSAEYPTAAPRPKYSVLSNEAWRRRGLPMLAPWREALHQAFDSGVFG